MNKTSSPKKRGLKIILLSLLVLIVVGITGLYIWASDKQRVIDLIEKEFVCDCSIDSVSYSLFSSPSGLELDGLVIREKGSDKVFLSADSSRVAISNLFSSPEIAEVVLKSPTINLRVDKNDIANWQTIKPEKDKKEEKPKVDKDGKRIIDEEKELELLNQITVENATINYENLSDNLALTLSNISIQTESAKQGDFTLSGGLVGKEVDASGHFLSIDFTGNAHYINSSNLSLSLDFLPESHINSRLPMLSKAWKILEQARQFGLKLDPLPEKIAFNRERSLKLDWKGDKLTLKSSVGLKSQGWLISVEPESYFDTVTTQHQSRFLIGANKARTDKLLKKVSRKYQKIAKKYLVKNDQVTISFKSQGLFSEAKVAITEKLPNLGDVLKGRIEDEAKGLLKKLF